MSARNMSHSTETTKDNIVWLDMEMTGLDPTVNHILEIACIITNSSLEEILVGPQLVLHHPEQILASMDQWNTQTHEKTGLLEASRRSSLSVKDAENVFLKFLQDHVPKEKCPLAGNTVYMDRMFLQQHMPEVNNYLHYHNIDVSSVKELCRRWYPEEYSKLPQKKRVHRALDDIRESIEELKFYQGMIFKHQ